MTETNILIALIIGCFTLIAIGIVGLPAQFVWKWYRDKRAKEEAELKKTQRIAKSATALPALQPVRGPREVAPVEPSASPIKQTPGNPTPAEKPNVSSEDLSEEDIMTEHDDPVRLKKK